MRRGLVAWLGFGLAVLGVKAAVDLRDARFDDVAVRAGATVYHVPRAIVQNGTVLQADMARLAGCWDARDGGLVPALAGLGVCDGPRGLHLDLARLRDLAPLLVRHARDAVFWRDYVPPAAHLQDLRRALRQGSPAWHARWGLYRLDETGTPWVHLLVRLPRPGEDPGALQAGRCFRADAIFDIGMTCTLVERLPGGAGLEVSLGPEGVADMPGVRAELAALVRSWVAR